MKLTTFLAVFCLLCFVQTTSFAQVKIGYTNADVILNALPDAKIIDEDLKKLEKLLSEQLESMMKEFDVKRLEYEKNINTWPKIVLEEKQNELKNLQQNIYAFQEKAEREMANKQALLLEPVFFKIQESINKVSKEHGFAFVFSSEASGFPILLYAAEEHDITNLIIKDLGGTPLEKKN